MESEEFITADVGAIKPQVPAVSYSFISSRL